MIRALRIAGVVLAGLVLVVVLMVLGFRGAAAWRERADASAIAPPTGRYVATRAGRLFLQEAGPRDAIPVVLFHGTAAWSELWRQTMAALAGAGFRAIALDMPPFGFSDRHGGYTRAEQAARVADMLDGLAIPAAIIVGHSFGAGAATETVLRFPSRARGLVLVDAALGLTSPADSAEAPPLFLRAQWPRDLVVSLTVTNPLVTRMLLAQLIEKKERATPEYVAILQKPLIIQNTTSDVARWLAHFLSTDTEAMSARRDAYARITAPTAILWGDKDTVTPLAQAQDLRALIPHAVLTVLPGLGHIPQIEDPESFNRVLIAQLLTIKRVV